MSPVDYIIGKSPTGYNIKMLSIDYIRRWYQS